MSSDATLPILQCGHPLLRRTADDVNPVDLAGPPLRQLISDMRATMEAAPGVGLAAPQVGVPLRLAVLQDSPERWGQLTTDDLAARERAPLSFTVMVNPVLTPVDDEGYATFYEGCLSVPGLTGVVRRYRTVRVDALDEHGRPFSARYSGWPARIAQHEVDHLAGALYLDRAEARSISTVDNYAHYWARRPLDQTADVLGFNL